MYHDGPTGATNTLRDTYEFSADGKYAQAHKSNGDPDTKLAGTYTASATEIVLNVIPTGAVCQYPGTELPLVYTATATALTVLTDNKLTGINQIVDVVTYTKQ